MIRKNKHIEIVSSSRKRLSSMSEESRAGVLAVLARHYARVGITIVNNLADLEALVAGKPDLVFLGMNYIPQNPLRGALDPDKIWLSQYFDEHGIVYTGSGPLARRLELDKSLAKQRVLDAGLKTSPYSVVLREQPRAPEDVSLTYPLFVKPTNRGGGVGIDSHSVVRTFDQLTAKVTSIATKLRADSLIEKYLPGREFSVAILKHEHSGEFSVMPIELVAAADEHGERILSGSVKSSNKERVSAVTEEALKSKVCTLALDVFHALGARDYGRIDIRLDQFGVPHFLEANLLPSLISGYGSFPKACEINTNLAHESMILAIVRLALARAPSHSEAIPTRSLPVDAPMLQFELS